MDDPLAVTSPEQCVHIMLYSVHMDVGIRELKQHLSEYMRRVSAGETIRVTDRGVPTAIISPIFGGDPLQRGIDEGWIRPALHQRAVGESPRARADRRSLDVLHEDRDE